MGAPEISDRALQTVLFPLPIPPVMATLFIFRLGMKQSGSNYHSLRMMNGIRLTERILRLGLRTERIFCNEVGEIS